MRALARRHSVHRRTVRQALAANLPPTRRVASRSAPALGPHRATIRAWLTSDLSARASSATPPGGSGSDSSTSTVPPSPSRRSGRSWPRSRPSSSPAHVS